jgi:hypothetical protein
MLLLQQLAVTESVLSVGVCVQQLWKEFTGFLETRKEGQVIGVTHDIAFSKFLPSGSATRQH